MSPAVGPRASDTRGVVRAAGTLLAIDSCGRRPGAALWDGGAAQPVVCLSESPARAEGLAACVQGLLDAGCRSVSSISCLAVLTGPGSYTGLRTGLAFVRGLALLDGLPVAPVSALERLAFCAAAEGERVIATWQGSADLVVATAYRIIDGLPVPVDAGGALDGAQFAGFVSRCMAANPGPWVLAVEYDYRVADVSPAAGIDSERMERRVVDSQTIEDLARLGYHKWMRGLGVPADEVLPDYFGTSLPRSNRNRVAAPFVVEVTR